MPYESRLQNLNEIDPKSIKSLMTIYIHIRYYTTVSIFANGLTFDYTAASISGGIALFLPEHSGFVSSEATGPLTDETPPGPDETVRIRIYHGHNKGIYPRV